MFKLSSFFINTLGLTSLNRWETREARKKVSYVRPFFFFNCECHVTFTPTCILVLRRWAPCSSSGELTVNSEFVPDVEGFALDFRDERWFDPHKCSCSVLPGVHCVLICQHAMDGFKQRNGNRYVCQLSGPLEHVQFTLVHLFYTWESFKSLCCGECLDRIDSMWQETGGNSTLKNSIICSTSCTINLLAPEFCI
jgi:hypothetical protein